MKKRRLNGDGTITQRDDGRWEARVSLPNGKRKCFYGKSQDEVNKKLKKAQRDIDAGLPMVDNRQTIAQYLQSWLEVVQHQLKPSSLTRYKEYVNLHIVPVVGHLVLTKLSAQQVQALYAKKLKEGLSSTTVQHMHVVLHKALKDALRLGLIQRNVTEMVSPPRKQRHEMEILNTTQVRAFLGAAQGDRLEALYILAVTCGMRLGELLALRWRDVDLEHGMLQVRGSLQRDGNKFVIGEPKTTRSRRRIALSSMAIQALKAHYARQDIERILLGDCWENTYDVVFPNTFGHPLKPSYLSQFLFHRILDKADLPSIRFHDLRHTAATLLLSKGVNPKIVSEMLGHSQISITLDVYSHVTPHMQQQAASTMDDLLGGD